MRACTAAHCIVKGLRVLRSNTQSSMGSPLRSNSPFPIGKQESEPTLCIRLGTAWFLVPSSESNLRKPRNLSQRSEEHTSELQSRLHLVCRLLLEKKTRIITRHTSLNS